MELQDGGGALGPFDDPVRPLQDCQDMAPLNFLEAREGESRRCLPLRNGRGCGLGATGLRLAGQQIPIQLERPAPSENNRTFNDVLQLTDIARPRIGRQELQRLLGHGGHGLAELVGELGEKEHGQEPDVLAWRR